ncbi:penicillin-binding protein 1C [Helicobacter marmotae]|uniref:peptidoglycan glycosyltransferase n=1 Tax=Helicobacter marmotae TaxID=152490 RepID=A0A3D8I4B6_9HELI|nr:penicillin-binding protein 1C [Helicobacter marmotae]RDU59371.1 penicillin-binding protein 1C [Helicobacter marmotae]
MKSKKAFAFFKGIFLLCGFGFVLFMAYGLGVFVNFYQMLKHTEGDIFQTQYSKSVVDRNGVLLSVFLNTQEQWHLKSPTQNVPLKLYAAVLTYEDKHFDKHFGIDILALLRSLKYNASSLYKRTSNKHMGGSTISMQAVKLYTKAPRTFTHKINEIFQTLALEVRYSKNEILNMYLNNAPYGGNIVGYYSAALLYFNKEPNSLSWAESALLAVLPNAPGLINLEKNTSILRTKRNALLYRLHQKGYFNAHILSLALQEKIPAHKLTHHNIAPHLSTYLALKEQEHIIHTTIDKAMQMRLESTIKQYHHKLLPQGILNLAALIVDTQSGEILCYVGSQDFLDIQNYGQIDGIRAMRSPGSLLKPFLYALSIDDGLIAPESLLIDVPIFFANFHPQNALKTYQGLVMAQYALQKSLNVPFVKLLQIYGYEKFFFKLQSMAGFSSSNPYQYGLSFILGSKEMNMLQIARLYRGLGNYGLFGDVSFLPRKQKEQMRRFLTKGSAYLTLQTLKELEREGSLEYHKAKMTFSWKSGTSYGRKDAWAAGSSPKYTIVVWAGNFTGKPNPNILGVKTAGSLLFEILSTLPDNNLHFDFPSQDIISIEVDKFSGYTLSDEHRILLKGQDSIKSILYPSEANPLRTSPFYRKVFMYQGEEVDSYNPHFIDAAPKFVLKLPHDVLAYYQNQDVNITKHIQTEHKNVRILYPTQNLKILQPKDFDGQKALIIRIANLKNQHISWYLNTELIHHSPQSTFKIFLKQGSYHLSIVGEDGSMDSVKFEIE